MMTACDNQVNQVAVVHKANIWKTYKACTSDGSPVPVSYNLYLYI